MDSICGANCNDCGYGKNNNFILICEYGVNGDNPELVLYKKR